MSLRSGEVKLLPPTIVAPIALQAQVIEEYITTLSSGQKVQNSHIA
jgi:hypothetical protein